MLTAVVCSGRKRPQDSNGQWDPRPRDRLGGAAQLPDLPLELGQPPCVVGRRTRPDTTIDLALTDPVPQRLGMNSQLVSDPLDRPPRGRRVPAGIHRHPRRSLLQLNAVLPRC